MSADISNGLGRQQAALLAALLSDGPLPAGFDAARIQAAARGLEAKRKHAVTNAWPILSDALGDRYSRLFDAYTASNTLPTQGNAQLDGYLFCEWLAGCREFPREAVIERMRFDLHYFVSANRVRIRRGPRMLVARSGGESKWVVALRLPWFGEYWLYGE